MKNAVVEFQPQGDPYAEVIEQMVRSQFSVLSPSRSDDLMELVVAEFIGTKNTRLGPRPNPESEVMIRDVVRRCIEADAPIPILIPAAAVKVPVGKSSIDLAELCGLKTLQYLQERILRHYSPGLDIRIRMEDATEFVISDTVPDLHRHVESYVRDFRSLVQILGLNGFITSVCETELVSETDFIGKAEEAASLLKAYLDETDDRSLEGQESLSSYRDLFAAGWQGGVSAEMRRFFSDRYRRNYPNLSQESYNQLMSRYLGCVLSRRFFNAAGNDPSWPSRLEISFVPPLPDAPRVSTRVHYRTLDCRQSANHMAWWCGKGIACIGECGSRIILANWWNLPVGLQSGKLALSNGRESVQIVADYAMED